jgi:hypothetical protein
MTKPDEIPLPEHSPLCRNLFCDGRCMQEMMARLERWASDRTRRGNLNRYRDASRPVDIPPA